MIAVPADAIPRWAFFEFLRAHGFEVLERPGEIEVAKDTFVRVWWIPDQETHIAHWLVERITEACGVAEDDVANFFASLPDPNLIN